ncbi:hypothetical protein Glove_375g6 [Diversispora epigaea]|uniref:Uncharacterized protein n=1 Tax=Diversispora epigaea TaxID=1348612 RepID=A0A397H592_9GLOM|nr:hypothetical protein Glove_375g6 [Diversispora epigaea]
MFESVVTEYLETMLNKNWTLFRILEFAQSKLNPKLSVATIDDFKKDLHKILRKFQDKCNVHVNAKNKASKILSNFDSSFSTAEVKQFINDLEYHEEARINVTSTYIATVLRKYPIQKRERSVKKLLDAEGDDDHSYKRDEESSIEWEFDAPKPNWIDKISQERDSLISNAFNCDKITQYELSLNFQLNNNQLHTIEKIEQKVPESDNLFEDKKDNETDHHKEIPTLAPDDCMNPDVAFIFDLIRFTCEMISKGITQQPNTERDIDVFIKRHIFSCFDTILDIHFGEMVSRFSRNR